MMKTPARLDLDTTPQTDSDAAGVPDPPLMGKSPLQSLQERIDAAHTHATRDLVDVLDRAPGARRASLGLDLTTVDDRLVDVAVDVVAAAAKKTP